MKTCLFCMGVLLLATPARAEVRVFVEDDNGAARLKYECSAGEVIRSFALDVRVDRGQIIGVADFFRGQSRVDAQGYGIFPAAFRDHITVSSETVVDWNVSGYSPLAVVADKPDDTLPGLNSDGATLEFGGLWDASVPGTVPPATGTLCTLRISESAQVSVTENVSRGGVLSAVPGVTLEVTFAGAFVDPRPIVTGIELVGGGIRIFFRGGELESAPAVAGPWTGTGNRSGTFSASTIGEATGFYRVRSH